MDTATNPNKSGPYPAGNPSQEDFAANRPGLEELVKRRFFYTVSYEIYNGVKGLYDYGPAGSTILSNIIDAWRDFFILEENMLQINTSSLAPDVVFRASGHCEKFTDWMVKSAEDGECYRADHLLKESIANFKKTEKDAAKLEEYNTVLDQLDNYGGTELGNFLKKYNIKAPETGYELSDPFPFNLMFATQIGPTGKLHGYLRPETAQGMFVNFKRLLDYNTNKLPFAAAQIGPAYRNEIAPRSGLLRVREFTLAEIEHFVDPADKSHPKFASVKEYKLPLFSRKRQDERTGPFLTSIGEAVAQGIVDNETLGYFLVRVHMFLLKLGIRPDCLRFRQHMANEMAHYARDCWDAEIKVSYGWIECVGNADRHCYDLHVHQRASGKDLSAFVQFDKPREMDVIEIEPNKGKIGQSLKTEAKPVFAFLESIKDDQMALAELKQKFDEAATVVEIAGKSISKDLIKFTTTRKNVAGKHIQPSVIEPSFGLGRILYCVLEHSYWNRENDEQRKVLSLKPIIAPIKCSVLPLTGSDELVPQTNTVAQLLLKHRISTKVDTTGNTIGRRYARTDELGCPFGVTIDFEGLPDKTVTLRERDTTEQVRVPIAELANVLLELIDETTTWEKVQKKYPKVEHKEQE